MFLVDDDPNKSSMNSAQLYNAQHLFQAIQTALNELPHKPFAVGIFGRNEKNQLVISVLVDDVIFAWENMTFDQLGERFEVVIP